MNLQSNYHADKYNRIVHSPELGVTIIESMVKPMYQPVEKLVYSGYDSLTNSYTATLSVEQKKKLSDTIIRAINQNPLDTPALRLLVRTTKGSVFIDFNIDPRFFNTQVTMPNLPGLAIYTLHRKVVGLCWEVAKSDVKWPVWLTAKE